MKIKTIRPGDTKSDKVGCVIDFVPMVKRNVGIGYVTEREATPEDFKLYPVVLQPWINEKGINKGGEKS
jgi:hypothetical protein